MPTISRWICTSTDSFSLETVKQELKKLEEEKFRTRQGERNPELVLRYTVKLHDEVIRQDLKYLSGTLYFEHEQKSMKYEITDDGVKDNPEDIKVTYGVLFWISNKNLFLFSKSEKSSEEIRPARELLSNILFNKLDGINGVSFDVNSIEDNTLNTQQDAFWTFGFHNRKGKITSATYWGDNISQDALYLNTGDKQSAKRKSVGIKVKYSENFLKTRVTKEGTILMYPGFNDTLDIGTIFDVVERFIPYHVTKKPRVVQAVNTLDTNE